MYMLAFSPIHINLVLFQKHVRKFILRTRFLKLKRAVIRLQGVVRGVLLRIRLRRWHQKAIQIQRRYRGYRRARQERSHPSRMYGMMPHLLTPEEGGPLWRDGGPEREKFAEGGARLPAEVLRQSQAYISAGDPPLPDLTLLKGAQGQSSGSRKSALGAEELVDQQRAN